MYRNKVCRSDLAIHCSELLPRSSSLPCSSSPPSLCRFRLLSTVSLFHNTLLTMSPSPFPHFPVTAPFPDAALFILLVVDANDDSRCMGRVFVPASVPCVVPDNVLPGSSGGSSRRRLYWLLRHRSPLECCIRSFDTAVQGQFVFGSESAHNDKRCNA